LLGFNLGTGDVELVDTPEGGGGGVGTYVSVFEYLSDVEIADVQNGTRSINLSGPVQLAINAVKSAGGTLFFPAGEYRLESSLLVDYSAETVDPVNGATNRITFRGEGGGATQLVATHGNPLIDYRGGTVDGLHGFFNLYGISLFNTVPRQVGSIGVKLDNLAFWVFEDVAIFGFETGIYGTDILSGTYRSGRLWSCINGFRFEFVNVSRPNAISFHSVAIASNRRYGGYIIGGAAFTMYGGSVEGNGLDCVSLADNAGLRESCWGLKFEDSGIEGATGAVLHGTYFEGNCGKADVWITQNLYKATHCITGATFVRYLAAQYTLYNVLYTNSPATDQCRVALVGCGFRSQSPYTESALRPYVGSPVGKINDEGSYFQSVTENDRATTAPRRLGMVPYNLLPLAEKGSLLFEPDQNGVLAATVSKWRWVEDKNPTVISTDANYTLVVYVDLPTIIHTGTLTTTRTLTLATGTAYIGARYKVTRLGAGVFDLSVGGLINLRQNQWAEVIYDGSSWLLIAAGALSVSPTAALGQVEGTILGGTTRLLSGVLTTLIYTEVRDTRGEFDGTTFTAQQTGYYMVNASISSNAMAQQADTQWNIRIRVNGSDLAVGLRAPFYETTGPAQASVFISRTVRLFANDALTVVAFTNRVEDADQNLLTAQAQSNWLTITQIS
jgi:hypothetical protein